QTVRELLMVRGVTRQDLLGDDVNQNDLLDSGGGQGDDPSISMDAGWSALMTVNSTGKDLNAAGKERVNVQTADEAALTGIQGISRDIARAIIAYRAKKPLQGIADLLDVTNTPSGAAARDESSGKNVIDNELFMQIADDVTIGDGSDLVGLVN